MLVSVLSEKGLFCVVCIETASKGKKMTTDQISLVLCNTLVITSSNNHKEKNCSFHLV